MCYLTTNTRIMYQQIVEVLKKVFPPKTIFKYGFNWAPMYRRTVGRVSSVSDDLTKVTVKIPHNYKNRNYVGATFGGSLFSATDPIFMIQLIYILGDDYVVWDKVATIRFKRPVFKKVYAHFEYTQEEIEDIKARVAHTKEIDLFKNTSIVDEKGNVYSEIEKTIYVATKEHYLNKLAARKARTKKER